MLRSTRGGHQYAQRILGKAPSTSSDSIRLWYSSLSDIGSMMLESSTYALSLLIAVRALVI